MAGVAVEDEDAQAIVALDRHADELLQEDRMLEEAGILLRIEFGRQGVEVRVDAVAFAIVDDGYELEAAGVYAVG